MAGEPYKDITWLRQKYVKERRSLKDIKEILETKYNVRVSVQTLYNWCEKYDLLKVRGKGRNLRSQGTSRAGQKKSPMQLRIAEMKREQARRRKMHQILQRRKPR